MSSDNGLQWDLDQELHDAEAKKVKKFAAGEGYRSNNNNNIDQDRDPIPPQPPPSPKPCLFEDPATRETIRRKLKELGVSNINQLIRNYQAAELIEAIADYERAVGDGFRVRSPTGYFRSLLG